MSQKYVKKIKLQTGIWLYEFNLDPGTLNECGVLGSALRIPGVGRYTRGYVAKTDGADILFIPPGLEGWLLMAFDSGWVGQALERKAINDINRLKLCGLYTSEKDVILELYK